MGEENGTEDYDWSSFWLGILGTLVGSVLIWLFAKGLPAGFDQAGAVVKDEVAVQVGNYYKMEEGLAVSIITSFVMTFVTLFLFFKNVSIDLFVSEKGKPLKAKLLKKIKVVALFGALFLSAYGAYDVVIKLGATRQVSQLNKKIKEVRPVVSDSTYYSLRAYAVNVETDEDLQRFRATLDSLHETTR